jgi:hypothetical protein
MAHGDLIILKIIVRKEGGLERLSEEKECLVKRSYMFRRTNAIIKELI